MQCGVNTFQVKRTLQPMGYLKNVSDENISIGVAFTPGFSALGHHCVVGYC